jgi:hypothetical protein
LTAFAVVIDLKEGIYMGGSALGVGVVYLELVSVLLHFIEFYYFLRSCATILLISYVLSIFSNCVIICIYSNGMLCVWYVLYCGFSSFENKLKNTDVTTVKGCFKKSLMLYFTTIYY